jgi:hypothetical protein
MDGRNDIPEHMQTGGAVCFCQYEEASGLSARPSLSDQSPVRQIQKQVDRAVFLFNPGWQEVTSPTVFFPVYGCWLHFMQWYLYHPIHWGTILGAE